MNKDQRSFGKQLRKLRKWKGKSQQEVADELTAKYPGFAISQTNVSHLERRNEVPRGELLHVLADYYGVPVQFFFERPSDSNMEADPKIGDFLDSLAARAENASGILLHTDENSSGNRDTISTANNIRNWYADSDVSED